MGAVVTAGGAAVSARSTVTSAVAGAAADGRGRWEPITRTLSTVARSSDRHAFHIFTGAPIGQGSHSSRL